MNPFIDQFQSEILTRNGHIGRLHSVLERDTDEGRRKKKRSENDDTHQRQLDEDIDDGDFGRLRVRLLRPHFILWRAAQTWAKSIWI